MSIIEKLTEGILKRDVQKEGQALLNKWEKTGLLEGIGKDQNRQTMACLLENQAKELLREASTMAGGDVEGFAAVAFPIVRRVFGGLIANELVSVQPMSLPSGLIFFLDFTFADARINAHKVGDSIYGGQVVGRQLTGGVDLSTVSGSQTGFYNLANGYASPTGSVNVALHFVLSGTYGAPAFGGAVKSGTGDPGGAGFTTMDDVSRLLQYDPLLVSGAVGVGSTFAIYRILTASTTLTEGSNNSSVNLDNLVGIRTPISGDTGVQARWLTAFSGTNNGFLGPNDNAADPGLYIAYVDLAGTYDLSNADASAGDAHGANFEFPMKDSWQGGGSLGSVVGSVEWGLENNSQVGGIPEIDIKVDSVSITAMTKKLKAKWTPELQQDINAYHNLDAEVELTGILSEQIALEIDQEILEDLIKGAKAGTYYWSRKPGKFVTRTGAEGGTPNNQTLYPDFTGTVSEWYETLLETVNDVSAQIHRKTLRGGANFLVTSPEVANVLEFTSGFRADTTADENRGTAGAVKVGQISKKWDIYVDPYFPRNLVLVGRKGNSFLESGYVYAPYVPLQVTPTIFGPEDFVPRKGVMTRYGKKMVRPDMYGLVVVEDLV